jgi:UDP-N-acetylmuramate dehydrogenase
MKGELHYNESMSRHTTFKTGGPADIFIKPADVNELQTILKAVKGSLADNFPLFILGGGANLLVSDRGIRGIVIDMSMLNNVEISETGLLKCGAGITVDDAAEASYRAGFSGLDSFYGMPGTVGGGIWMNARCYGRSFSDILRSVTFLDDEYDVKTMIISSADFAYKISPFQKIKSVIIEASFKLEHENPVLIRRNMENNKSDREKKGHYAAPCAGSIFKNNRAFGQPSGTIIDSIGLRGTKIGGAAISEGHANIIINTGGASSIDILKLIKLTQSEVKKAYGFDLDPEIQLIGDFS